MAVVSGMAAWQALGIGSGDSGNLQKLEIKYETKKDKKTGKILKMESFHVLFNPNELAYSKSVKWASKKVADKGFASKAKLLDFRASAPETLSITLFFDTYEPHDTGVDLRSFVIPTNPFTSAPKTADVKKLTEEVADLARINPSLHHPPRCELWWGRYRLFVGVLTTLEQKFTLFVADGTPVRAELSCTFTELNTLVRNMRERPLESSDVAKIVVVQSTDTLHSIAAAEYDDASLWRMIAKANGIINPRAIKPGMVLIVPALQS
ncbi:MAG: LysM peptidoglycan-binding domain-containing protein [Caldilineaceae bacterium]|nr:LysM peptidoglycan-binding domain-containing protein [Caldilineaceae bacterium]MCB0094675.1 LysM peptidoglycan-binding domain-containing protein [Caldilineaceae bacterium]MCB0139980.1 LysM peptidoglycan-binding domain-containing protein [Caldilineaceae bacterium]